jgi:hypothetical protein
MNIIIGAVVAVVAIILLALGASWLIKEILK